MNTEINNNSFCQVIFSAIFRMYDTEDAEKDGKISKQDNWLNEPKDSEIIIELELRDGNLMFFARLDDMEPNTVIGGDTFSCKIYLGGISLKKEYVKEGRTIYLNGERRIASGIIKEILNVVEK